MKLVLLGPQPIEQLENWAEQYFSPIENKNLAVPAYRDLPFDESNLGRLVRLVPVNDEDSLTLKWVLDYLHPHYRTRPGSYISHLIGHEGENSLLSLLIDEGLALELSCGPDDDMRLFSFMNVTIKLTKKGLKNVNRVLGFVFQYVDMLQREGVQQWVFEESKLLNKLNFNFLEKQAPFNYVSSLSNRMHYYKAEEVLQGPYIMDQYDPELLGKVIGQLRTDNLLVLLSSREFKGQLPKRDLHFDTEYNDEPFPEELKEAIRRPF